MTEAKHTPGPWVVKFRNDHSCYISMGDPKAGPHKQFDLEFSDLDPSDVADARLIAAAPDLLSAISAMLTHMGMDEDEWNKPTFEQARAAIAKATGAPQLSILQNR